MRRTICLTTLLLAASLAGAGCKGGGNPPADAGTDAPVNRDAVADSHGEHMVCDTNVPKRPNGQACCADSQCTSTFCVDGVCCNESCTAGCKTCTATESMGSCVGLPSGSTPRIAETCQAAPVSTCGLDGTCDGAGGCRNQQPGVVCQAGTCSGDAVVGAYVCNGAGQCKPGATQICVPFSCDPSKGACYDECATSGQCVTGQDCANGSCGKRPKGATCKSDDECVSGFCTDGVCCNVACKGPCLACNLPLREGTCWPIDRGLPDPHKMCADQGAPSCGTTGTCDGVGGCALYPRDTICVAASCSGNTRNTPGTCDGLGACRPPGVQVCAPFRCAGTDCTTTCNVDNDCADGMACVNHSCGLKRIGQPCAATSECVTGSTCVDGVCCESVCAGACRSCNLPGTPGRCMTIAANSVDTRGMCVDQRLTDKSSCGTNGKCDGAGGCQKYPVGQSCRDESCTSNVYTGPSTCDANGQCKAPDSLPCSPYVCNGTKCFQSCTTTAQCLTPNMCAMNSCGLKPIGASCSAASECVSHLCEQGTCCLTACTGACRSCALPATLGTCTNVPANTVDPKAMCAVQASASCGTNGKCDGNGACQKFAIGTACAGSTCPATGTTFTAGSACDGNGTCVTPAAATCFPYMCGLNVCKTSCTADGDCAPPNVCKSGTCGLKDDGSACGDATECKNGFCQQGVCCHTACTGICQSCALAGTTGTCSNVANGAADPGARCMDQGAASCGTDGFCNGAGACRKYPASTPCAAPSCPTGTSTKTSGRTCDGAGVCQAATMSSCAPYKCNDTGTDCKAACTSDNDCVGPEICDPMTNLCGNKKRLGQACTATSDCLTGNFCTDGVCCSTSSCGTCQACNVSGTGVCSPVLNNTTDPHGRCAASPPCGNTGMCDGAGQCKNAAMNVSCGTASCAAAMGATPAMATPVSHCDGAGSCAPATPVSCNAYQCNGTVCATSCTSDAQCTTGNYCTGSAGSPGSCAAKQAAGATCSAAFSGRDCTTGFCVDGVCCSTGSCGTCQVCAGPSGTCTAVDGAPDPHNRCAMNPPCGNTGMCVAGACEKFGTGASCGNPSCTGSTYTLVSHCDGAGNCAPAPTGSCSPYKCGGTACKVAPCASDNDCLSPNTCQGGACALKADGIGCGGDSECLNGHCTDGVCCNVGACPSCTSCAITGMAGTCNPVGAGATDARCAPYATCAAGGACATSCGGNTDCQSPATCDPDAGTCG